MLPDFSWLRIAVIGDAMWDNYVYGRIDRISPEAPVPVFVEERVEIRQGGAANVAENVRSLGATALLIAHDCGDWPVKTRFMVGPHQTFRADHERFIGIDEQKAAMLFSQVRDFNPSLIIISDYAKGVVSFEMMRKVRTFGIPFIVDPKTKDWRNYSGALCVTPNEREWNNRQAWETCLDHQLQSICVTRGARGMTVYEPDKAVHDIAARPCLRPDVTGAGDTAVAALGCCLAAGLNVRQAAEIANAAASVVVRKPGTATCSRDELEAAYA